MGKIICEICGTTYPDTAGSCPICGYSQDLGLGNLAEDDILNDTPAQEEIGSFAAVPARKKAIFDYNEVNAEEEAEEEEAPFNEEEEAPRSNTGLVILLVVIIMLLLAATGFVFFRYYLPGMLRQESQPTETTAAAATETQPTETTQPVIPCESLVLTGGLDTLTMEGGNWLLHVVVAPADTTDTLRFVSEDESVVTVDENGKLTAVGEGETYVNILCGEQKIQCHIVVDFSQATEATEQETIPPLTHAEETEPEETKEETKPEEPQEETKPEETKPEETKATEPTKETEPEETKKEPQGQLKDVELKLKKTDITLGVGYSYTIPLDCELDYSEIEWSVEEPFIAKVENGKVTALMKGITDVVAKYGDQVVECRIRCS